VISLSVGDRQGRDRNAHQRIPVLQAGGTPTPSKSSFNFETAPHIAARWGGSTSPRAKIPRSLARHPERPRRTLARRWGVMGGGVTAERVGGEGVDITVPVYHPPRSPRRTAAPMRRSPGLYGFATTQKNLTTPTAINVNISFPSTDLKSGCVVMI